MSERRDRPARRVLAIGLAALALGGLGMGLYGYIFHLPYLFDDPLLLLWIRSKDDLAFWITATEPAHRYRPLVFSLWKLCDRVLGDFALTGMHGLSLALHCLNAGLVGVLYAMGRPRNPAWGAALAAGFFLTFPFSFQAVAYPNSLFHILVTACVLSAALFQRLARQRRQRRWWALSWLMAALAPFACEHGVMVGPLLWLAHKTNPAPEADDSRWYYWLPYLLLAPLFIFLWLRAPRLDSPVRPFSLSSAWQSSLYFLQGLTSPLPALAQAGAQGNLAALAIVEGGTLLLLGLWLARQKRLSTWGLGVGWYGLALLPIMAGMDFAYVVDGPRLMYLASVGAAWLWAEAIVQLAQVRGRAVGWGLALTTAGGVLAFNVVFLEGIRQQFLAGGGLARQALLAVQAAAPDERLLFVNFPSWLATPAERFPLGHEGVSLVPDYVGLERFVWANTGQERPVSALAFPDLQQAWRFHFGTLGDWPGWEAMAARVQDARRVYLVRYDPRTDPQLIEVGGRTTRSASAPPLAVFGQGNLLLLEARWVRQGEALEATLVWQAAAGVTSDWSAFVHLYAPDGRLVAQQDGYPVGRMLPIRLMAPGVPVEDVRRIPLPEGLPAGEYALVTGVYDIASGERQAVRAERLGVLPDNLLRLDTLHLP
jgi:hypothetical protein